jgi:SAM-dependent methyltransferase
MRSSVRRARAALALAASVALPAGCGSGEETAPPGSAASSASASTAEQSQAPDLASGLLAAEAFGPDASVVAISPEQLARGAGLAASNAEGLQITPEECAVAVDRTQPDFDDFDDVAAVSATTGSATTVEVLVRGGPTTDTVGQLEEAAARCPQAQITSPEIGSATITFEPLEVGDLGDAAALLRYTTAVALPDGTQATVPALIGAVQDGDRVLMLMNLETSGIAAGSAGAAADPGAFADLLERAYQTQAEALD